MNDYISLRIDADPASEDITDLLAAFLADSGYESFEPDESGLTAYIRSSDFNINDVENIVSGFPISTSLKISYELVEGKDWNEEWEKNYFQPIVIEGECVVHSTFHTDVPEAEYDIVIDPKMAFGTGHHATTSMMIRHLLRIPLENKRVIDMGTGTGILAILAMMRGAAEASGIEIDPCAADNARENVRLNNVAVRIITGDSSALATLDQADLFIANINRNVILADLDRYAASMKTGAEMLLSGFYESDIPIIGRAASLSGLEIIDTLTAIDPHLTPDDPAQPHGLWASIRLRKN